MTSEQALKEQLKFTLDKTNFTFLGSPYVGKVRDSYVRNGVRFLVTSDRLSAFDVVLTTIPFKGQILNDVALHWFELTRGIVPNHLIDVPDPNVMVVRNCEILQIEIVVRGYLAGSAWRDYAAGGRISGVQLPAGLMNYAKLQQALLTPSIKAPKGQHDTPISEEEIVSSGRVSQRIWDEVREKALALFELGSRAALSRGLILVDTKYEMGLVDGELVLADEIHTLDSSRYWVAESYDKRIAAGESPEMLDKEPIRQWLLARGYAGDGTPPEITDDYRVEVARHYLSAAQRITGRPIELHVGPVMERIESALRRYVQQ